MLSFIREMNELSKEIGLKNTHFDNPHGLNPKENYSTAYDLCLLSIFALKNPTIKKIADS